MSNDDEMSNLTVRPSLLFALTNTSTLLSVMLDSTRPKIVFCFGEIR